MSAQAAQPMVPQPWQIQRVRQETGDTFTMELEPLAGSEGFLFAAGQFNMLYVFGVGEVPISISGDPEKRGPLIHTTRAVGVVTNAMRKLKRQDVLGVRGPFGTPWPLQKAEGSDVVIVAGGLGLAPLRPAIYQMLAHRKRYGKVLLLYGVRTPADLLYKNQLKQWAARADLETVVTVDHATEGWTGDVGVVTKFIPKAAFDPLDTVALVCGPEIMMRFTLLELQKRGVTDDRMFVSMERNMKCALGFCGRCQYGPTFVCKDGPVFNYSRIQHWFTKREV